MEPIHPPATGITAEAAEALGIPLTDPRVVIDSEGVEVNDPNSIEFDDGISEVTDPFPTLSALSDQGAGPLSSGDSIDAAMAGNESGEADETPGSSASPRQRKSISALHSGPNWERGGARDATTKPPSLDEWTSFFGKVVLRITCDWYLNFAFRGIDEEMLTDRELERLALTNEERAMVAVPLAELSNKSKFMRKHGRTLVAAGDSFNALMVLGAWMSRVNRIASKYRPKVVRGRMNGANQNGSSGPGAPPPNGETFGTTGGRIANGFHVYNPGSS